ncbi:MAG: AEC family transporter [Eubacterium sp.]|nr:AEC family transporter [Eubacterium sp.]
MVAVKLAIELMIMTCIGVFAAKKKIVSEDFSSQLTDFLMKIAIPCLIIVSITTEPFSVETAKSCIYALVAGIVVVMLSFVIGQIFYHFMGKDGTARIVRYGLVFTHFSFMGIPVVDALFGTVGNLYYVIFLVPVRILYYALTPQLLGARKERNKKEFARNILNPCLIAVLVGILIWVLHIPLPEVVQYCLGSLNKICSPLGLILCGLIIGRYDLKKLWNIRFLRLPLLRTVMMPVIFFGFTRILLLAGIDSLLCNMIVIYTALPCASLTAVFALQYESDPEVQFEAAGSVFFATLLSTVTIPVWYQILEFFGV